MCGASHVGKQPAARGKGFVKIFARIWKNGLKQPAGTPYTCKTVVFVTLGSVTVGICVTVGPVRFGTACGKSIPPGFEVSKPDEYGRYCFHAISYICMSAFSRVLGTGRSFGSFSLL